MALWNRNTNEVPSPVADAERLFRDSLQRNINPPLTVNQAINKAGAAYTNQMMPGYDISRRQNIEQPGYRKSMLAMRLRIEDGQQWPFDDLHTSLGKEKVFVFIMQNDQDVVLEDEMHMFPSDALVTQLRLIAK